MSVAESLARCNTAAARPELAERLKQHYTDVCGKDFIAAAQQDSSRQLQDMPQALRHMLHMCG
jgi:hypothetical protein